VDTPYFVRLGDFVRSVVGPGFEVDPHGLQPGDRYLHPITEFRCAAALPVPEAVEEFRQRR
jgi:hypothetical protein